MARTGLTQRQFACAVLAVLVSLLSFAGVLQGRRAGWQGQGGSRSDAGSLLAVRLYQPATKETVQDPMEQTVAEATHASFSAPISETIGETIGETIAEAMTPTAGYVPAAELSERPILLQDLDPVLELSASAVAPADRPAIADVAGISTATGMLLINQQGSVDRLLFDPPGYPRYLEDMLALRFADVRFRPGKIDGKPVPSALRIIVQLQ